jgi:hypothetical protein
MLLAAHLRARLLEPLDPTLGTGNSVLSVAWTATSATDPVRDVRVWLPGMESAQALFWPPFLAKVRAVNAGRGPHTWRTLDWTRVNEHGRSLASGGFKLDRAGAITPASPSQGTLRGVAPELQVALCNALGMNLHFQVPHRTDDLSETDWLRFVHRQLRAIRDGSPGVPGVNGGRAFAGLDPALTVTVEFSNELWNPLFPAHAWMEAEAARKGIPVAEQIAGEIQGVFDVATAVFAGSDAQRLRTFVGGFVADAGWTRRILAALRPGTRIDALGPAAYLGPRRGEMDAWSEGASASTCPACPGTDALLAVADAAVEVLRPMIAAHRDVGRGWTNPGGSHPALVLYEAGVDFRSAGAPWAAAARAAHARPELFRILADRFVPMLVEEGVALVNWYSFMTDQDPPGLEPFGMWNDMEEALALPITRPVPDQGRPKAALVCLGPPLAAACAPASAKARTAAGNLAVYAATPPVLGRVFRAAVDLRSSGAASAFVVASLMPATVPLPSGQTLLSSLGGAELLPLRTGPIATWELALPNDARLAGIEIATQAILLGAGGVQLSNALDLTLGR